MIQDLVRQRDALNMELQELGLSPNNGVAMHAATGAPRRGRPPGSKNKPKTGSGQRGRPRGRRGNAANLVDSLRSTLSGRTLSVSELAEQVQKDGYKTTSANFRTIVNQALIANPSVFKKVARGQYTAR